MPSCSSHGGLCTVGLYCCQCQPTSYASGGEDSTHVAEPSERWGFIPTSLGPRERWAFIPTSLERAAVILCPLARPWRWVCVPTSPSHKTGGALYPRRSAHERWGSIPTSLRRSAAGLQPTSPACGGGALCPRRLAFRAVGLYTHVTRPGLQSGGA